MLTREGKGKAGIIRTDGESHLINDLLRQAVELRIHIIALFLFALGVLAAVIEFARMKHVPISLLTKDPPASLTFHSYTGALSYFGIIIWAACTGICLFTAFMLRADQRSSSSFFLVCGLFSALLTLDDLYMIHDNLPFHFGTPSWLDLPFYAFLMGAFLYSFRQPILDSDFLLLSLAAIFLGSSLLIDAVADLGPREELENFVEDGLKFIGILFWTTYFVRTAAAALNRRPNHSEL